MPASRPLTQGTRLGPYEIESALGRGGMGEVYRARDARLRRSVALKVLTATVAHDPRFRERFDREARAISALNHSNICTLFDIGQHDGIEFLVMELLDGDTLAARIARGPLPHAEVLSIATQIGAALDTAHRAGIVHRDLKPGNIMLTKAGTGPAGSPQAKLLDFGLARPVSSADGIDDYASRAHRPRRPARHAAVHGARTARGPTGGRAVGYLGVRLRAVRDGVSGAAPSRPRATRG